MSPRVCGVAEKEVWEGIQDLASPHWAGSGTITVDGIHRCEAGRTGKASEMDQPHLQAWDARASLNKARYLVWVIASDR